MNQEGRKFPNYQTLNFPFLDDGTTIASLRRVMEGCGPSAIRPVAPDFDRVRDLVREIGLSEEDVWDENRIDMETVRQDQATFFFMEFTFDCVKMNGTLSATQYRAMVAMLLNNHGVSQQALGALFHSAFLLNQLSLSVDFIELMRGPFLHAYETLGFFRDTPKFQKTMKYFERTPHPEMASQMANLTPFPQSLKGRHWRSIEEKAYALIKLGIE